MKKQNKKKEKFEIKWWEDWLNADMIKREEMVSKLPFVKEFREMAKTKLTDEQFKRAVTTMLNGFFEDLESAVHIQIRNEDN
jgi:hypothetical protein